MAALLVVVVAPVAGTAGPTVGTAAAPDAGAADRSVPTGERCLVVERAAAGEPLLSRPVSNGTAVALSYTHSVEKSRVVDGYEVRGDRLEMVRMAFSAYGAGLPARADVNRTDDGAFVFDPDGAYQELYVQPGPVAGHVLRVGNVTVDLVALSGGDAVRLHLAGADDGPAATGPDSRTCGSAGWSAP